jgi:hypothetical protein
MLLLDFLILNATFFYKYRLYPILFLYIFFFIIKYLQILKEFFLDFKLKLLLTESFF